MTNSMPNRKSKIEDWIKRISFTDDKLTIDGVVINDVEDVDILIDFIVRLLQKAREEGREKIKDILKQLVIRIEKYYEKT